MLGSRRDWQRRTEMKERRTRKSEGMCCRKGETADKRKSCKAR